MAFEAPCIGWYVTTAMATRKVTGLTMNSAHAPTLGWSPSAHALGVGDAARWLSWPVIIMTALLLVGAGVRFANLGHSSFVFDEVWRAHRVADYSLSADWGLELFSNAAIRPPVLLYHMTWITTRIAGLNEWSMRVPSAVLGVLCIVAVFQAARVWFGVSTALWASAIAAFHPVLWYYSRHAQPYAADMLCTAVILLTALSHLRAGHTRSLVVHTAACVLALGFSYASAFSILAWLPILAWAWFRSSRRRRPSLPSVALSGAIQMAAIAVMVWWASSHGREFTMQQWERAYNAWPASMTLGGLVAWLRYVVPDVLNYWIGLRVAWIYSWYLVPAMLMLGLVVGLATRSRANRYGFAFLIVLYLGLLLAGATRLWPFVGQRTVAFVVPIVCILAGAGLERIATSIRSRTVTVFLLAICVGLPAARAAKRSVVSPLEEEHLRPVVAYVKQNRAPTDALFVYNGAHYSFDYYWPDAAEPLIRDPSGFTDDKAEKHALVDGVMSDHPCAWFLFTRYWKHEHDYMTKYFEQRFRITDAIEFETASAYRVERITTDSVVRKEES